MRRSGLPVALSRALNAPLTPREYTAKARVARRGMAGAQLSPYMIRIILCIQYDFIITCNKKMHKQAS